MSDYVTSSLRRELFILAHEQCEYCLIPQAAVLASLQIDHIIARKHRGKTELSNLAVACTLCNKYKGSDLASIDPQTSTIVPLFHPRHQRWLDHFDIDAGYIVPRTATGRVTVILLQLNRTDRVIERKLLLEAGIIRLS